MAENTSDHVAHANTTVAASAADVWRALTSPEEIKQYMMGSVVTSDWKAGSPITWKGEFKGRTYEDKGRIVRVVPERLIEYTHFSPLSGAPDVPENYHTVTIELSQDGDDTRVALSQTNNPTPDAQQHSEKNWGAMLDGLKRVVEKR